MKTNDFIKECWQVVNETSWPYGGTLEENLKRGAYPDRSADYYEGQIKSNLNFETTHYKEKERQKARLAGQAVEDVDAAKAALLAPIIADFRAKQEAAEKAYNERIGELLNTSDMVDIIATIRELDANQAAAMDILDKSKSGYAMDKLAVDYRVTTDKAKLFRQAKELIKELAKDNEAQKHLQSIELYGGVAGALSPKPRQGGSGDYYGFLGSFGFGG